MLFKTLTPRSPRSATDYRSKLASPISLEEIKKTLFIMDNYKSLVIFIPYFLKINGILWAIICFTLLTYVFRILVILLTITLIPK